MGQKTNVIKVLIVKPVEVFGMNISAHAKLVYTYLCRCADSKANVLFLVILNTYEQVTKRKINSQKMQDF